VAGGGVGGGGVGGGLGGGRGGAAGAIVAFMNGCRVQWYANVPALANVCELLWPACSVPLSKAPPSAVAVWSVGPSFVQVTVSPTLIVIAFGPKAKSRIATPPAAAARALAPPPPP